MRRAIATVSLSGTLQGKLQAARRAGFNGVELFENDLLACPAPPSEVRRWADDLGLRIELYQPFRDFETQDDRQLARNLERAEAKFDVMEQLGTPTMLVCSSVSPLAVDDDERTAAQLHELAERAGRRALRVAYEALAWGRHVNDWRHSYRIVERGDHPHLGVCLDSFHIQSRGDTPPEPGSLDSEKLFYVQLADAPRLSMDVLQWSRHYRCFPGQGNFDVAGFLAAVLRNGYHGPLSLEVFNDVFRQSDTDRTAVDAMRSLLLLEEEVGRRLEDADGDHDPIRSRIELYIPPAAPALDGLDFVEVGVEPSNADDFDGLLEGLGFNRVGQHRTKPVTYWGQGQIGVLVNREVPSPRAVSAGVWLAALGLRSRDPRRSGNRADALLVAPLARRRGVGEIELPTAVAPDGTAILFTPATGDDERAWTQDFDLVRPAAAPDHALDGVDHVAMSLTFEQFDEGVLFFRSVLGLSPEPTVEVADTHGLLRSRALSDDAGTTRIALTVPLLGAVDALHDYQHVAFGTPDIIAAVQRMQRSGLRMLPIPGNYYDDLAARGAADLELLAAIRSLGVLYDRSDDIGEFLHAFTEPVGGFFFEIVQRVDGYDGYGAPNAPIRLAALRSLAAAAV